MPVATDQARTAPTLHFADIVESVRGELAALDAFLAEEVRGFEPELRDMVDYCLRNQGKRLRPLLVFYSGYSERNHTTHANNLVRAAAVVELVHQATLVHDDILDTARVRHSEATPWARYGATAAVLLGDALFAQALNLAAGFDTVDVCRAVSRATRRVCAGEIAQTLHRGSRHQNFEHYFRVIELKTAELFQVSCELGARLAGYPRQVVEQAAQFGLRLGRAYQIFDDLTDFAGDELKIGKTLGTDLASGKYTLPLLHHLECLPQSQADALHNELASGAFDARALLPQLIESGALSRAVERFELELAEAEAALQPVAEDYPAAQRLVVLSHFVRQQISKLQW